jgi:hypothetical protein
MGDVFPSVYNFIHRYLRRSTCPFIVVVMYLISHCWMLVIFYLWCCVYSGFRFSYRCVLVLLVVLWCVSAYWWSYSVTVKSAKSMLPISFLQFITVSGFTTFFSFFSWELYDCCGLVYKVDQPVIKLLSKSWVYPQICHHTVL